MNPLAGHPIRVLAIEPHPVFAEGLTSIFSSTSDMELIRVATSGGEGISSVGRFRPDVVLLEVMLPDRDGLHTIQQILANDPPPKILLFTDHADDALLVAAVQQGARGYMRKTAGPDALYQAIRSLHEGGSPLDAGFATLLMNSIGLGQEAHGVVPLSERELRVLALMAAGRTNAQIAEELIITENTVKTHVRSILSKLEAPTRAGAVAKAVSRGLINGSILGEHAWHDSAA